MQGQEALLQATWALATKSEIKKALTWNLRWKKTLSTQCKWGATSLPVGKNAVVESIHSMFKPKPWCSSQSHSCWWSITRVSSFSFSSTSRNESFSLEAMQKSLQVLKHVSVGCWCLQTKDFWRHSGEFHTCTHQMFRRRLPPTPHTLRQGAWWRQVPDPHIYRQTTMLQGLDSDRKHIEHIFRKMCHNLIIYPIY